MKNVLVLSTVGNQRSKIQTAAERWGILQQELLSKGYSFNGMKVIVGETSHTLENSEGLLPNGDFTLMIFPVKNFDSGSLTYKEARERIKTIKTLISESDFRNHFGNYTQLGTEALNVLISSFESGTISSPEPEEVVSTNGGGVQIQITIPEGVYVSPLSEERAKELLREFKISLKKFGVKQ